MVDNRITMPSTQGGLVRYFEDYKSKIEFKPGHIIILVVIVILIEVFLHWQGLALLGLQ
ncbi:MAG TPA: preprotein translocase subunit Sec61beta [Candidatus Nanoarchaeia archaeon]|nr:preprotein translocase subunit Sec61beta [Candidatus Nanoarchaeia archaeon]